MTEGRLQGMHTKRAAMRLRPILRRTGFDLVRFPGKRHDFLRSQMLKRLAADLVIDVGANAGQFAAEVRAGGYGGKLVSFEPMSDAYTRLAQVAGPDPAWDVQKLALGAESGELLLNIAGNSISSSLLPMLNRHSTVSPLSRYVGTQEVSVDTLDHACAEYIAQAQSPFLKIDTQGYEHQVLAGARDSLAKVAAVELELSLVPLYEGQVLLPELVAVMQEKGFRLTVVSSGLVDPSSGETLQVDAIFERVCPA